MANKIRAFDIVLMPPEKIAWQAQLVSRRLAKKGGLFTLDGANYFPHITLYAGEFFERNIPKIETILYTLAWQTRSFAMTSLHYRQEEHGYVGVDYRKSKSANDLRKKIIDSVHPFCEYHKKRKKNEPGWCSAEEEFIPHLTFTKFEKYTPSALRGIKEFDFSFRASSIGLYYLGEYGTCRKLVQFFDLPPQ